MVWLSDDWGAEFAKPEGVVVEDAVESVVAGEDAAGGMAAAVPKAESASMSVPSTAAQGLPSPPE